MMSYLCIGLSILCAILSYKVWSLEARESDLIELLMSKMRLITQLQKTKETKKTKRKGGICLK